MPVLIGNPLFFSVDELFGVRTGTPYSRTANRKYTRKFRVIVNSVDLNTINLNSIVVSNAPFIPVPGSFYISGGGYEYDLHAVLTEKTAEEENKDDWQNWIVTCNYETVNNPKKDPDHPENDKPDIEWDEETMQIAPMWDANHKPFLSSSNMPMSPPITKSVGYPVLCFSRNELVYFRDRADAYCYALNNGIFMGRPRGSVQCEPIKVKVKYRGDIAYWRVSYRIKFAPIMVNPNAPNPPVAGLGANVTLPNGTLLDNLTYMYRPWQPYYLDQSMYRLDNDAMVNAVLPPGTVGPPAQVANPNFNKPTPIWLRHRPVTHPVLLDGLGQPAVPEVGGPLNGIIRPRYIFREIYRYLDFTDLLTNGVGGNVPPPSV